MGSSKAFTLVELLVVVGIIAVLVTILVPNLQQASELANRTVCMSNLSGISKALIVYRNEYDQRWPWLERGGTKWDTTPTGTNRETAPPTDANQTVERSVTALMFLLVRERQPAKLFTCPSDRDVREDKDIYRDPCDPGGEEFYWDFSSSEHVSYSWQAPLAKGGGASYVNGIDMTETDAVIIADKTPKCSDSAWQPKDVTGLRPWEMQPQMSQNHSRGKKINALRVAMNVVQEDRPDIGVRKDNIYTAARSSRNGSQAVSLTLSDHLVARDSFLIGPVAK